MREINSVLRAIWRKFCAWAGSRSFFDHSKSTEMWSKLQLFDFSPKTAQTILIKLAQNVVLIDFETIEKNACENHFPF